MKYDSRGQRSGKVCCWERAAAGQVVFEDQKKQPNRKIQHTSSTAEDIKHTMKGLKT